MEQIERVARTYLETLYSKDFENLKKLVSPDIVFEDPTASPELGIPKLVGIGPYLKFWETNLPMLKVELEISDGFASNGHAVLYVNIEGTGPAERFGRRGRTVKLQIRGLMIIQVSEGLVVRHTDNMDYAGLFSNLQVME